MKKIYVIPTLNIERVDVQQMLAVSIKVDSDKKASNSEDIGFVKGENTDEEYWDFEWQK